jgi:hypothetical protein
MPPPPAPKERPWVAISIIVAAVIIVGGYVALNIPTKVVGPASVTPGSVTPPSPSVAPSPLPLPAAEPVDSPMDVAISELHQTVYVQQFCNMVDKSGIDFFARLIDLGKPWKTDSIGSAWVAAQNRTGYSIMKLATEFYGRYC